MNTQTIDSQNDASKANATPDLFSRTASPAPETTPSSRRYPRGRWTTPPAEPEVTATASVSAPVEAIQQPALPQVSSSVSPEKTPNELALETVKPLRNDLHDSDLEFVLSAEKAQSEHYSYQNEAVGNDQHRQAPVWSRIAARIFGSQQS